MKRLLGLWMTLAACSTASRSSREPLWPEEPRAAASAVRSASAEPRIEANWKERLAQPYVYVEHAGDYRRLGDAMRSLFARAEEAGIEHAGPPFALFFDDPGSVPTEVLRARACL